MNLMLNRLPSRTWNRLGMNESLVSLEGEYHTYTPKAEWDSREVSWIPGENAGPQGLHGDLEPLVSSAPADLIETAEEMKMTAPVVLTYSYGKDEKAVSRLKLHAAKNSRLQVVLLMTSSEESQDVTAIQTEIYAEDHSVVDICLVQLLGSRSLGLNHIAGIAGEQATVNMTRLELGAAKQYSGVNIDLQGRESAFNTDIGYHCKPGQLLDMNYVALHHGRKTNSLMEISGTLEEESQKIFRGTIDFQQGCAGAKGTENENVLLMGDQMVNQTVPLILCKEEDVEGNHGASIGQLDEKVLFYLGSRGISREAAQQIIAEARIEAICSKIPVAAIQDQVREYESVRGISHEAEF